MWVEYDNEAHLLKSLRKSGAFSPLTRSGGSNKLGQVILSPIEEQGLPSQGRTDDDHLLRGLAVSAALYALGQAQPHISRVMTEQVAPAVKAGLVRALSRRKRDGTLDALVEPSTRVDRSGA
jgi:hypothetical protein